MVLRLIKISWAVWGDGSIFEMLGSSGACTLTLVHKHAPMYTRTHMHTTYTQAYSHRYTYTFTQMHTPIYTHTYIHTCNLTETKANHLKHVITVDTYTSLQGSDSVDLRRDTEIWTVLLLEFFTRTA